MDVFNPWDGLLVHDSLPIGLAPKNLDPNGPSGRPAHQIGAVAIFGLGGFLIEHFGWRSAFIIPAFVSMGLAFFLFNRLRDTPKEVGLPPVEEYKGDDRPCFSSL